MSTVVGGGTVYWTYSYVELLEPNGLMGSTNFFASSNNALYGKSVATQGITLVLGNNNTNEMDITDYMSDVPPFTVILVDYYGQQVLSQSERDVTVTARPSTCFRSEGYLAGIFIKSWNEGVATFDRLQAYCAPGYNLSLSITYNSIAGNIDPTRNLTLVYRPCLRGEHLAQERSCSTCETGTYSLTEPSQVDLSELTQAKVCRRCPEYAETCYGDQIIAKSGYWRNSDVSPTVQHCPFDSTSCLGGADISDASCKEGFEGPLCAVCERDFTYSPITRSCTECGSSFVEVVVGFVILLVFMGIAYWGYRKYSALKLESKGESIGEVFAFLVIKSKVLGESITSAHKSEVEQQVEEFKKRMIGLARVFLTYCQIITVR